MPPAEKDYQQSDFDTENHAEFIIHEASESPDCTATCSSLSRLSSLIAGHGTHGARWTDRVTEHATSNQGDAQLTRCRAYNTTLCGFCRKWTSAQIGTSLPSQTPKCHSHSTHLGEVDTYRRLPQMSITQHNLPCAGEMNITENLTEKIHRPILATLLKIEHHSFCSAQLVIHRITFLRCVMLTSIILCFNNAKLTHTSTPVSLLTEVTTAPIYLSTTCPLARSTINYSKCDKKAQLSLTNPRDACEKFAHFA